MILGGSRNILINYLMTKENKNYMKYYINMISELLNDVLLIELIYVILQLILLSFLKSLDILLFGEFSKGIYIVYFIEYIQVLCGEHYRLCIDLLCIIKNQKANILFIDI